MGTSDGRVLGTTQVYGNAPRRRAFNVVVLAEGFRTADQATFNDTVDYFVQYFLATPPFDRHARNINVFRVNVISTDAGADDAGAGTLVRTYFDAEFSNLSRLLLCNEKTALLVAGQQVPEYSVCLVAVNTQIYGGAGGGVATFSLHSSAMEIAIHEMGHTAFKLADEYAFYSSASEPGHDHHPQEEPTAPNITIETDRSRLKWRWAVAGSTPLPTTRNGDCSKPDPQMNPFPLDPVGCYEGAHYYHCGAYRPQFDCKMRQLGYQFCKVCESVIDNYFARLSQTS
jgi:hypothetical protein